MTLTGNKMVAIKLISDSINKQKDLMLERVRKRRMELAKKKKDRKLDGIGNETMPLVETGDWNVSRISPDQLTGGNQTMEQYDDNSILKGLDDTIMEGMPSDEDDENPELLEELERRQEELLEEYIEIAMQKQEEMQTEVKAMCKTKGMKAKETSGFVAQLNEQMEKMRKDGRRKLRRKLAELAEDEEIALPQRISQLIE